MKGFIFMLSVLGIFNWQTSAIFCTLYLHVLLTAVKGRWECGQEKPTLCSTRRMISEFGIWSHTLENTYPRLASSFLVMSLHPLQLIFMASLLPAKAKIILQNICN